MTHAPHTKHVAKAAVLVANGFEEIETVTIIDVLRRAGVSVEIVGVDDPDAMFLPSSTEKTGAHQIRLIADGILDETMVQELATSFDVVILPGGLANARTLQKHPAVQAVLAMRAHTNRLLAAICAAPIALGAAGVLQGKRATCYPGFADELGGATYCEDKVVHDGNVVTSRGVGTALDFALSLAALLTSETQTATLRQKLLHAV